MQLQRQQGQRLIIIKHRDSIIISDITNKDNEAWQLVSLNLASEYCESEPNRVKDTTA